MSYIDKLAAVASRDIETLKQKDAEYGGSWKRRGGIGAYMMAARKIDRLEEQMKKCGYDIFAAIQDDRRDEGVLDDLRDLRRYLLLIEAEMVDTGVVTYERRVFNAPVPNTVTDQ